MGLQNHLTDVSSDSLPIFLLATIAKGVYYLRSLAFTFLPTLHISSNSRSDEVDHDVIGSGLAGLILLADQLNLNRVFSYRYSMITHGPDTMSTSGCIVCLNSFVDGEHVRKLARHHVFHKECFDGWLDQLKFKCPLCRSSLVSDERVAITCRRVTDDVVNWFFLR